MSSLNEYETKEAFISPEIAPQRLDRALALAFSDLSRNRLQALIRDGKVQVDGVIIEDIKRKIPGGVTLTISIPPAVASEPIAEEIPLDIIYEDGNLIVINKPAGLVVHPAAGHESGTLVNALISHCGDSLSGIGGVKRPGIVHRLDKDTSGLMVVAKNDIAHRGLAAQFADHGRSGPLKRAYAALIWGVPPRKQGTIDAPLARSLHNREKITVVKPFNKIERDGDNENLVSRGRNAITHYVVEESFPKGVTSPDVSLVRCTLETGRTHQIRVHLSHIGHPLLGDRVYGSGFNTKATKLTEKQQMALHTLGRQALHAIILGFEHPVTGETMTFESPLPGDLATLLATLR